MDLHFEFNKKIENGYLSVVKNNEGEIIAQKVTKKEFDIDKFVLNMINDKKYSWDFRKNLKKALKKARKEFKESRRNNGKNNF